VTQQGAGTVIGQPGLDWALCAPGTQDARAAAAEALARYLFAQDFVRTGGTQADGLFRLKVVRQEWPEPDEALEYPSASIIDYGDGQVQGHDLGVTVLEDTLDVFGPGTVLVKSGELVAKFQVDFWADDLPTREAMAANLPRLFAPGLTTSRLLLRTGPRYFGRPVRCTLLSWRRDDDASGVYVRERRLMAIVQAEIDMVDLRAAQILIPSAQVDETTGPEANIDPGCAYPADHHQEPSP
jgi:hypothetical protein